MGKETRKAMKRFNLSLPVELFEYMDKIIEGTDSIVSHSELIRRAVKTYCRLLDDAETGKKIYAEDDKGKRTEYIIL